MKSFYLLFILFVLLITGCKSYDIPQVGENHPGHMRAPEASNDIQTKILEVDKTDLPLIPSEMKSSQMNMKH